MDNFKRVETFKPSLLGTVALFGFAAFGLGACATALSAPEEGVLAARSVPATLHERLLVMDTHLDTPANFSEPDFSLAGAQDFAADGTQVDLPRMVAGGLDGGFWVIYTAQGELTETGYRAARDHALIRAGEIREAAARHHEHFELAFRSEDAARIHAEGKRIIYQSMENAYPLGRDVSLLETFYKFGLRMVGPVHFANNQFADSATDPVGPRWGGLSAQGRELVKEANRLGLVLDGSHAHDKAVYDMIARSKTPLILSHTGVKAVYDHPRNIDDALLEKLAETGGVIQINAYSGYLEDLVESPERILAFEALEASLDGVAFEDLSEDDQRAAIAERDRIDRAFPPNRSSFDKFAEHLLYALKRVGPDHVGIGADWDGGGGVGGMEDIASLPRITQLLLDAGYMEADIAKIWSGNMLRILKAAEDGASANVTSLPSVR